MWWKNFEFIWTICILSVPHPYTNEAQDHNKYNHSVCSRLNKKDGFKLSLFDKSLMNFSLLQLISLSVPRSIVTKLFENFVHVDSSVEMVL